MSESDGEQAARSLALEQAYVHEVYEQCADRTVQGRHWPRIYQFLEELEPGALVCDIGCGNGKYLEVNENLFKIGADRCQRFTSMARDKEKEVLACDNLSLPFRDESFDAVLSIAVVHHFSTTERRVRALKELARVLRIGGRLIISVWAMEQKHRKFESQDVLVPWPKAYCISPMKHQPRGTSHDDRQHRGTNAQTYLLSKRSSQRKGSKSMKSYWIEPIFSPSSPSTSSLSSPNETCYSFFRRALQKLAGGRRSSRAWFLENWQANGGKHHQRAQYEDEDDGDVDDLPIELRRLEEPTSLNLACSSGGGGGGSAAAQNRREQLQQQQQRSDSLSVKSRSLGSIVEVQRLDLVRSRSSIPGLCGPELAPSADGLQEQERLSSASAKPRLVKQKTHFLDDACCPEMLAPENTATQQTLEDIPELQQVEPSEQQQQQQQQPEDEQQGEEQRQRDQETSPGIAALLRRGNVHKQSSMNEELMSIERLKERESVRRNIMKQASLNEELIYKSRPAFEAFKDSFYSGSATKRFQLLKSGLTNRIKQSTTNIEKVSGMSIKNGFVRILQSWKSTESPSTGTTSTTTTSNGPEKTLAKREGVELIERRLSREDGSDSSKDSSLQSDTSVDSEDSFASVIYVPKKNSSPLIEAAAVLAPLQPSAPGYQLNTTSAPPSPRVKYAPELATAHHARLKLVSVSPLLKQFPATSKSLPPPSPPGLSPRTLNQANMRPFFSGNEVSRCSSSSSSSSSSNNNNNNNSTATLLERIAEVKRSFGNQPLPRLPNLCSSAEKPVEKERPAAKPAGKAKQLSEDRPEPKRASLQTIRGYKSMSSAIEPDEVDHEDCGPPLITEAIDEALERLSEKSLGSSDSASAGSSTAEDEESRRNRLNQIKELLRQKPGFASRAKPAFPLVRRASTASTGRLETVSKVLPRLLSLELFNPETDDLDSDSSGVSSPESVGSVISVISDERYVNNGKKEESTNSSGDATCSTKPDDLSSAEAAELSSHKSSTDDSDSLIELSTGSSQSLKLLEAAANVASSLEDAVGTVIQQKPSARPLVLDKHISPVESTWNEECKRHLIDLTDRLSENLIHDIDQFCRRTKLADDDDESSNLATSKRYSRSSLKQSQARQAPDYSDLDNNKQQQQPQRNGSTDEQHAIQRSCSEESDAGSFVVVTNSGEFLTERELRQQRYGNSIESSDIGDSIENTISSEASSQPESLTTRRFCTGSTASLASSSLATDQGPRAKLCAQARSASEEIPARHQRHPALAHQQHQQTASSRRSGTSVSNGTLSGSSSQESLPSDQITYHQYYHVFREGELDQLINKYVENLHIISSYYDHASWCIVAEKVQVWTI